MKTMSLYDMIADMKRRYEAMGGELEPNELRELREAVYASAKNARGLQVLFGTSDHGAVMAVYALKKRYDHLYDKMSKRHMVH